MSQPHGYGRQARQRARLVRGMRSGRPGQTAELVVELATDASPATAAAVRAAARAVGPAVRVRVRPVAGLDGGFRILSIVDIVAPDAVQRRADAAIVAFAAAFEAAMATGRGPVIW